MPITRMMTSPMRRSLKKILKIARKSHRFFSTKSQRTLIREISRPGHRAYTIEVFGVSLGKRSNVQALSGCKGRSRAPKPRSMTSRSSARALPPRKDPRPIPIPPGRCNHPSTPMSERTQCLTACRKRPRVPACLPSTSCEMMLTWAFGVHSHCKTVLRVLHILLQVPPAHSLIRCSHRSLSRYSMFTYLLRRYRIRTIKKQFRTWSS